MAPLWAQPVKIYQDAALNESPAPTPPAPAAPAPEPAVEPPSKEARKMAQKEEMRRAQQVMEASQAINAGDIFYQAGEYAKASERYAYAYGVFQSTGLSSTGEQRAKNGLVQVKIKQAEVATQAGDFAHASALLDEAEKLDPSRKPDIDKDRAQIKDAQVKLAKQRVNPESTTNNPVLTPDFKDKIATVQRFLFEGDRFFETGQYDKANDRYRQALVIDPYNKAARSKLDRLDRYETRAAEKARETTRTAALYDIERRWTEREQPVEKAALGEVEPAQESNIARLSKKLSSIKIDSISFVSQPIDEAVRFLSAKAKQADPSGEGINFVLKENPTVAASSSGAKAADGTAPAPAPVTPPVRTVTLSLNNVSLGEVLRVLTQLTNLKYKIDEYAIYILPSTDSSDVLVTRTFVVPTGFFEGGLSAPKASANGGGVATTVESVKVDVKKQLMDQGVDFPPGATAAYLSGSSRLVVKDAPDQLDRIDALLQAAAREEDPQIEIETKFAEFTDTALKQLQFNWALARSRGAGVGPSQIVAPSMVAGGPLNPPPGGFLGSASHDPVTAGQTALRGGPDLQQDSLDAILQNSVDGTLPQSGASSFLGFAIGNKGLGVLMNLIDQLKGVDLLSAPKVTTKNRTMAKIEINEQMTYPSQFTPPTFNNTPVIYNNNQTVVISPPTPSNFEKATIGVTLQVTPVAYADRRIDLDLQPDVTDFEGFVDYGASVDVGDIGSAAITPAEVYHIRQPVFNNRKIATKLQVIDGQTVVLGGLVREDTQVIDDKVPLLGDLPLAGRLFRSKVDMRTKRNLLVFITARIIRSTGKAKFIQYEASAPPSALATSASVPAARPGDTR